MRQAKAYNELRDSLSQQRMETDSPRDVTQLLIAWSEGDQEALNRLMPMVYDELRRLAARQMRRETPGHTLQTTALVNEAYCKLIDQKNVRWQSRVHFFSIASQLMRRILIDHARKRASAKRGGGDFKIPMDELALTEEQAPQLLVLDDALKRLADMDPRKGRIVEMKFFGGLNTEEIAEVEKLSTRTVEREWRKARAWLYSAIQEE
jgi:RNA polymerase sigma factor (TIGR02999 family)